MNKLYFIAVIAAVFAGADCAAWARERAVPAETAEIGDRSNTVDFDIDLVVDATIKAMAGAARGYYMPDKPENLKTIARYTKDSRKVILMNTAFKEELARICVSLSGAADNAVRPDTGMLPGRPLELPRNLPPVEDGVSSITVTEAEGVKTVFTNTMPCISAAAKALHRTVREQYMSDSPENAAAKAAYGRQFGAIMTENRLFNHLLSEVCAQLVQVAKREMEQDQLKNAAKK